jgi:hypothetical protein
MKTKWESAPYPIYCDEELEMINKGSPQLDQLITRLHEKFVEIDMMGFYMFPKFKVTYVVMDYLKKGDYATTRRDCIIRKLDGLVDYDFICFTCKQDMEPGDVLVFNDNQVDVEINKPIRLIKFKEIFTLMSGEINISLSIINTRSDWKKVLIELTAKLTSGVVIS